MNDIKDIENIRNIKIEKRYEKNKKTKASIVFLVFLTLSTFSAFLSPLAFSTSSASDEKSAFSTSSTSSTSPAKKFQKAMQYAGSLKSTIQIRKDSVQTGSFKFEPKEVFKDQTGGYTDNPSQAGYYGGVTQDSTHVMEKDAIEETIKDDEHKDADGNPIPSFGKVVTKNFQTRPVFKITQGDEYMQRGNLITKNAKNIVTGVSGNSDNDINCEAENSGKKPVCQTKYVEKTCNEEVRSVKRICEQVPSIKIKEELYPGCQVRVLPSGKEECLIGTFGIGTHKVVVPKHLASRVEVNGSRHGYFYVTVINDTTGKTLYNHSRMNNGVAFELTFSDVQDQTYRLIADRSDGCNCRWPGHLTLYIDHKYKTPNIEWEEEYCRDI